MNVRVFASALLCLVACKPGATESPTPQAKPDATPQQAAAAEPSTASVLADSDLPETIDTPLPGDDMGVTIHRLSNGMTVYISTDRQEPRFAAWIGVRAGSRMDPPDSTGLAHYLEHMLFKGTDDYGTRDASREAPHIAKVQSLYDDLRQTEGRAARRQILRAIDRETQAMAAYAIPNELDRMYTALGVSKVNAFTSNEQTVYISEIPTNRADAWITIEAERFSDPMFRLFYPELEAVYEEKNLSLDSTENRAWEAFMATLFPSHPYGTQTTIGEAEHLKNPAFRDMVEFYEQWYAPNNMAIALAGDVDASIVPKLEKAFGHLEARPLPEPGPGSVEPLPKRVQTTVRGDGQPTVTLGWVTVPEVHPDEPVLVVLDRLLDDESVGRLNVELELTQKIPSVSSWVSNYNEGGYFGIEATARKGQDLAEVEAMVLESIQHLKDGKFTDADVEAVKLQEAIDQKRRNEDNWARTRAMMFAFITHRDWTEAVARDRALQQVTRDDVIRAANQYLTDRYAVVRKVEGEPDIPKLEKPVITPVPIDASLQSEFAQRVEAMPAEVLEPQWASEGEHYEHRELPSGRMIAVRNERNDLFSVTYYFKRGYRKSPLQCFALDLLDVAGAGSTSAEELQKQLYALGSTVSTRCDAETSRVTVQGVDANMDETLALVRRWFAEPTYTDDDIAKLLDNTLSRRREIMESDRYLGWALDTYAKYGKDSAWLQHPSNRVLSRARSRALRRTITELFGYRRQTLYFGPQDADRAADALARKGTYRPTGEVWRRQYRTVKKPTIYFTHKDGAKATVTFALPRDPLKRDARPVAELVSEVYSGSMSGLVFQEIRESRGLAYTAWAGFALGARMNDASSLRGSMKTQADKTPEALRTFLSLLDADALEPKRVELAKQAMEQEFRSARIDPRELVWWVRSWDELGEVEDPRPREWKIVQTTTMDELTALMKTVSEQPVIVAVLGDRERVGLDALAELGTVVEVKPAELFSYGAFPATE